MTVPSYLFVCLGNICRSPLAEAAFRAAAEAAGLAVYADSAGTAHWNIGSPPDRRSAAVAARHGIDITGQRARQVTVEDFTRFDHILALDARNLRDLQAIAPRDATARLRLLLDLVPGREGHDVDDPYYGGPDGFDRTWDEVTRAAEHLLAELRG